MPHCRNLALSLLALIIATPLSAQGAGVSAPGTTRVRIETTVGTVTIALDTKRAPNTTANFLAYVDDGRLDGTTFYRAARSKSRAGAGFVQGGIGNDARRSLGPIVLERTDQTGITHTEGAVSMARGVFPNSAAGDFVLLATATPNLDARPPDWPGYAAFGKIVAGMDVVKRILAGETWPGGSGATRGQLLKAPIKITKAVRLDGTPKPTGQPKVWEIIAPRK